MYHSGIKHALTQAMYIGNSVSEPSTLLLVGTALLATSLLVRFLKKAVRSFNRRPKVGLRAQESLLK